MNEKHYIAISVSRRKDFQYEKSDSEIIAEYSNEIKSFGTYPKEIAGAMGDKYFFARFDDVNSALEFKDKVLKQGC